MPTLTFLPRSANVKHLNITTETNTRVRKGGSASASLRLSSLEFARSLCHQTPAGPTIAWL